MTDIAIYGVKSIEVESEPIAGGRRYIDIIFTDDDGKRCTVTAYCPAGIEIQGAEFVNFQRMKEPA